MAGVNVGRSGSQRGLGKRDARIQPISKSKIHFCCFTHLVYPALQSFNLYSMVSMKNGWRLLQIQLEVTFFLLRGVQLWPRPNTQASNAHVYGMRSSSLMRSLILQAGRMRTAQLPLERQIETERISPQSRKKTLVNLDCYFPWNEWGREVSAFNQGSISTMAHRAIPRHSCSLAPASPLKCQKTIHLVQFLGTAQPGLCQQVSPWACTERILWTGNTFLPLRRRPLAFLAWITDAQLVIP